MALPKINNSPMYSLTIPSTKKSVRFRPYLVKEEKILMLAMESQDPKQMLNAIADTITSCIEEPVDVNQLTSFDIEYMFIQLRSKSVGEVARVGLVCGNCKHTNEVQIKVDDIAVEYPPEVNKIIKLSDKIQLKMKWPRYNEIVNIPNFNTMTPTEQSVELISLCIDSVQTEEESIRLSDEPKQEVLDFIDSLNSQQFKMIKDFVDSMPKMKHSVATKCTSCGVENTMRLEGIKDFF
jgi:hypothetical protein